MPPNIGASAILYAARRWLYKAVGQLCEHPLDPRKGRRGCAI